MENGKYSRLVYCLNYLIFKVDNNKIYVIYIIYEYIRKKLEWIMDVGME
jgi:hypothetical protein